MSCPRVAAKARSGKVNPQKPVVVLEGRTLGLSFQQVAVFTLTSARYIVLVIFASKGNGHNLNVLVKMS